MNRYPARPATRLLSRRGGVEDGGRGADGGDDSSISLGTGGATPLSRCGARVPRSTVSGAIAYGGGAGRIHARSSPGSHGRSLLFRIATHAMMSAVPIEPATTTIRSRFGLSTCGASQSSSTLRGGGGAWFGGGTVMGPQP